MKKIFLALLLCGMAVVSKADGDIINEDFSSEEFNVITANANANYLIKEWKFFKCSRIKNGTVYDEAVLLQTEGAYMESPAFGSLVTTKVVLDFSYANTVSDKKHNIVVIINNGGRFKDGESTKTLTVAEGSGIFYSATLDIFDATDSTTLTFSVPTNPEKSYYAVGMVKVTSVGEMLLSEDSVENNIIPQMADVKLERTLKGGIWNTFCLPFDVDTTILKRALGEKQNIQLRTFAGYENNVIKFSKVERVEAGTPFLIKLNSEVKNPEFECVDVKETQAQTVTHGDVSFVGVYSQTELPADDGNVYMFLTANGALVKPKGDDRTLKGMRAYFSVPAAKIATARIAIDGDGTTSVHDVPSPVMVDDAWYTLSGVRYAQQPAKGGLYVKNGKKVVLK